MPLPSYRDQRTASVSDGYTVTNEEPEFLTKMLGRRTFGKAASIISGGEVLFSVILPRCREVIGIDHSYKSIVIAYMKAIMLETMGAKALKELFFTGTWDTIKPILETAYEQLPEELKPHFSFKAPNDYNSQAYRFRQDIASIRREWFYMPTAALDRAKNRLDKVTFIHGDITDIEGQVGLLYTSNATEHSSVKLHKPPTYSDFAPLVKKGGLLLTTGTAIPKGDEWEHVKSIQGIRSNWKHNLYRRK